jgi:hypothetical protein
MNTDALVWMLTVFSCIAVTTFYVFYKVLKSKK